MKNGKALGAAVSAALFVLIILTWGFRQWAVVYKAPAQESELQLVDDLEKNGLRELKGQRLDQSAFSLQRREGEVVVLNFWASWCGPCLEEVPSLVQLVESDAHVRLIAVSQDSNLEDIESFLKAFPGMRNPQIDILWDQDRSLADRFHAEKLPESYVFNRSGKLAKKVVGSIDWSSADALSYIQGL